MIEIIQGIMVIDTFDLLAFFTEYNNLYFDGMLPYPQFGLLHGCQTVGYFSYLYDVPFGTSGVLPYSPGSGLRLSTNKFPPQILAGLRGKC